MLNSGRTVKFRKTCPYQFNTRNSRLRFIISKNERIHSTDIRVGGKTMQSVIICMRFQLFPSFHSGFTRSSMASKREFCRASVPALRALKFHYQVFLGHEHHTIIFSLISAFAQYTLGFSCVVSISRRRTFTNSPAVLSSEPCVSIGDTVI